MTKLAKYSAEIDKYVIKKATDKELEELIEKNKETMEDAEREMSWIKTALGGEVPDGKKTGKTRGAGKNK